MRRIAIFAAFVLIGLASFGLPSMAVAGDVVLVHQSFSVQVVSVDDGITEIAPFDFYEIAYTINQSVTDTNSSIGAGTFPGLATAFSLAARPLNALPWHPMGTFDVAGSNYVTNAFGDNYTFQMRGSGFPDGGPGLAFFDLDLRWTWPGGITDSGLNDQFAVQVGGGTFIPARAVLRPSAFRFRTSLGEFREATFLPVPPALAGDYNANGRVDAADYTVWRNSAPGPGILVNDATPGTISNEDYDVWKAHFDESLGSGFAAGDAAPEPASAALFVLGMMMLASRRGTVVTPD